MPGIGIYYIQNYKISDNKNDKIIAQDEVQIKSKDKLSGKVIVDILEKTPSLLNKIIDEMGGVGYAMLALEGYLFGIDSAKIEEAKARLKVWEKQFEDSYTEINKLSLENKLKQLLPYLFHMGAIQTVFGFLPKEKQKSLAFDKKKFYQSMQDRKNEKNIKKLWHIVGEAITHLKSNPKTVETLIKPIAISRFIFVIKGIKYKLNGTLTDALLYAKTDCDRYASLFVHFAKKQGFDVSIFSLNDHSLPIFNSDLFPNGRIFIESTDGYIADLDLYKKDQRIACLQLGFPDSLFIKDPEMIVTSVFTQKINDLLGKIESGKGREKDKAEIKRYMLLANKLVPNDPSKLILSQMVFMALGDKEKAEMYRLKAEMLLKGPSSD